MQPGQQTPQQLTVPGQIPGHVTPMNMQDPHIHHYRGFSQSPTSIKTVKVPDYFPEWKHVSVAGMEEATFLGAQVAGKVVFMVDAGANKGFMSRTEYNELGPAGIHEFAM
jgi:actin-related protein 9